MGLIKPNIAKLLAKQDIKGLIKALENSDESVREDAANALGTVRGSQAIESLIATLEEESENVQIAAIKALGKMNNAQIVKPLHFVLKKTDCKEVLEATIEALENLTDTNAVELS